MHLILLLLLNLCFILCQRAPDCVNGICPLDPCDSNPASCKPVPMTGDRPPRYNPAIKLPIGYTLPNPGPFLQPIVIKPTMLLHQISLTIETLETSSTVTLPRTQVNTYSSTVSATLMLWGGAEPMDYHLALPWAGLFLFLAV